MKWKPLNQVDEIKAGELGGKVEQKPSGRHFAAAEWHGAEKCSLAA